MSTKKIAKKKKKENQKISPRVTRSARKKKTASDAVKNLLEPTPAEPTDTEESKATPMEIYENEAAESEVALIPVTPDAKTKIKCPPSPSPVSPPSQKQLAVQVHRFRNAKYIPRGILRLCSTPPIIDIQAGTNESISKSIQAPYLAISREGGSVELVSVNERWKCIASVEGMKQRNVDAMTWVCGQSCRTTKEQFPKSNNAATAMLIDGENSDYEDTKENTTTTYFCQNHEQVDKVHSKRRLFGASRDGTLFEIDFKTKKHTSVIGSGGGAVFCLSSLCPYCQLSSSQSSSSSSHECCQLIAAGCEDGSVRIFSSSQAAASTTNNTTQSLELISTLPSVGSAVLSIAWMPPPNHSKSNSLEGSVLYAGVGDGTIRKFVLTSRQIKDKLTGTVSHAISTGLLLTNSGNDAIGGGNNATSNSNSIISGLQWKASTRITVESQGRRVATKIWTLCALKDGTVISGDSMGNIQFWDGNNGTLLQSFQHNPNHADVLDIISNFEQNKVMASGIDSRVVCIESSSPSKKWILSNQQRSHTHDVNSLAMVYMTDPSGCADGTLMASKKNNSCTELLCSGGLDTKVCSYFVSNMRKYRPKIAYKYPSNAHIVLAKQPRIMTIMRSDKIDFFQIADNKSSISNVALDEEKAYLGSVNISSKYNLVSFDLNDDGTLLAVSHAGGMLLFSLEFVQDGEDGDEVQSRKIVKPTKLDIPSTANMSSSSFKFSRADGGLLVCATTSGPINVLKITKGGEQDTETAAYSVSLEHTFSENMMQGNGANSFSVSHLDISPDGRWLATARNTLGKGSVNIFTLSPGYKHWWTLPCTEAPLSCMKWLGDATVDSALAVALNNGVFYLFDTEQRCLSDWSQDLGFPADPHFPEELKKCKDCPDRLAFNPATPSKFLMGGQSWFCLIDLDAPVPTNSRPYPPDHFTAKNWGKHIVRDKHNNSQSKKRKLDDLVKHNTDNHNFTICLRYSGMIFLDFLNDNEMIVVEQPWLEIVNTLPDALERHRYGS